MSEASVMHQKLSVDKMADDRFHGSGGNSSADMRGRVWLKRRRGHGGMRRERSFGGKLQLDGHGAQAEAVQQECIVIFPRIGGGQELIPSKD